MGKILVPGMIFIVVCGLMNLYVINDIRVFSGRQRRFMNVLLYGLLTFLSLGMMVFLSHFRWGGDCSLSCFMWMSVTALSIYLPTFLYVVFSLISRVVGLIDSRRGSRYRSRERVGARCVLSHNLRRAGVFAGLLVFVAIWMGSLLTRNELRVTRTEVGGSGVPSGFDGYRIVQFSDFHAGGWGNDTTFVSSMVDSINGLDPDMVVFTGDIVTVETGEIEPFVSVLSRIKARDGVFSILGNHDYGDYRQWKTAAEKDSNLRRLRELEASMGWELLDNEHRVIHHGGDSIILIGVENWGEPPFRSYGRLDRALSSSRDSVVHLNDDNYKVLLSHNPEHWNREVKGVSNVDLTLSGHTHAMQTQFGNWSPAKWRYPLWRGVYEGVSRGGKRMMLNVNIGIGGVGVPMRLGAAQPEITLLTLRHE